MHDLGPRTTSHTYITRQQVPALSQGALDGFALAVKDNIDVEGVVTTAGTRFLEQHVALEDAPVVRRLREAGAHIVGKTNLHELGHGITGLNPSYGDTLHPENPAFTAGGSSGGSALAVHEGSARVALGTDTGGSVRIPAAYTGLVGYRPSRGRYPADGIVRISPTRDTVGVIANSVADVVAVDAVITRQNMEVGGETAEHDPLVIGVLREHRDGVTGALAEAFDNAIAGLRAAGFTVIELDVARHLDRFFANGITVLQYETASSVESYLASRYGQGAVERLVAASESLDTREIMRAAIEEPVTDEEHVAALAEIRSLHEAFVAELTEHGVSLIAYPTSSAEPPRVDAREAVDVSAELRATVMNSTPATLVGSAAISLPAGRSRATGLPVGLTLEHVAGDDEALLRAAALCEPVLDNERRHREA